MEAIAVGTDYFTDTSYPVTVCKVDYGSEVSHGFDLAEQMYSHDFNEIVIIASGRGVYLIDGHEYVVSTGDVFLVQGYQKHYFKEHEDLVVYKVMYSSDSLPWPEKEFKSIPGYHAVFMLEPHYRSKHKFESRLHLERRGLEKLESIINTMLNEIETKGHGFEAELITNLYRIVVFLSRSYSNHARSSTGKSILRVAEVIGELERSFSKPWTLSELARFACMSEGNLMRVFKEATGQSPIDYLISLRLQRAVILLEGRSITISEIAFEVGFNDSNYFTRCFKKKMGMTPGKYRVSH